MLNTVVCLRQGWGHAAGNASLLGCTPSPIRYILSPSGVTEASSSSEAGMVWPLLHLSY